MQEIWRCATALRAGIVSAWVTTFVIVVGFVEVNARHEQIAAAGRVAAARSTAKRVAAGFLHRRIDIIIVAITVFVTRSVADERAALATDPGPAVGFGGAIL